MRSATSSANLKSDICSPSTRNLRHDKSAFWKILSIVHVASFIQTNVEIDVVDVTILIFQSSSRKNVLSDNFVIIKSLKNCFLAFIADNTRHHSLSSTHWHLTDHTIN